MENVLDCYTGKNCVHGETWALTIVLGIRALTIEEVSIEIMVHLMLIFNSGSVMDGSEIPVSAEHRF